MIFPELSCVITIPLNGINPKAVSSGGGVRIDYTEDSLLIYVNKLPIYVNLTQSGKLDSYSGEVSIYNLPKYIFELLSSLGKGPLFVKDNNSPAAFVSVFNKDILTMEGQLFTSILSYAPPTPSIRLTINSIPQARALSLGPTSQKGQVEDSILWERLLEDYELINKSIPKTLNNPYLHGDRVEQLGQLAAITDKVWAITAQGKALIEDSSPVSNTPLALFSANPPKALPDNYFPTQKELMSLNPEDLLEVSQEIPLQEIPLPWLPLIGYPHFDGVMLTWSSIASEQMHLLNVFDCVMINSSVPHLESVTVQITSINITIDWNVQGNNLITYSGAIIKHA